MEDVRRTLATADIASSQPRLSRPFHFILVVWGERFRSYFLDLCLPTLLSARNLPSLKTQERSKFLICTRPEDWAAMQASRIFQLLERYVDPVYLEIPPCPADTLPCLHMGIGHRRACELAFAAKAYGFVLTPDVIFSDGTIERLQSLATQGIELALVPALRFAEEPLFDELQTSGICPRGRNGSADPITIDNRDLVRMALASMHSETKTYEWDAPCFNHTPSAVWWRVPGEDGIVLHSLSWAPLLLDFAAVRAHDTSTLESWTIDGDYIYKNMGHSKRVHVVTDSDEIFIAAWAPSSDRPHDLTQQWLLQSPLIGRFARRQRFNAAFYGGSHDQLKQQIFFESVRWHTQSLNENWIATEKHAHDTLLSCVAPPAAMRSGSLDSSASWSRIRVHGLRMANVLLRPLTRFIVVLRWLRKNRYSTRTYIKQMLSGDGMAWRRTKWRLRQGAHYLLGRRFNEPEPGI